MKKPIFRTFYKVVDGSQPGKYFSVTVERSQKHAIQYFIGKWAKPKIAGSRIFVFDSLEDARRFRTNAASKIFACETRGTPTRPKYMSFDWDSIKSVRSFWKSKDRRNHPAKDEVPEGTIYVDAVKLLHEEV